MISNISLTIPSELLKKIDIDRGDIPRSRFIIRLLESDLKVSKNGDLKKEKMVSVDNSSDATGQQIPIARV